MRTADFNFDLPAGLIAQHPAPQRDESRLLVLHRANGNVEHCQFRDLPGFFRAGDVLVLNHSRVIPARLRGANARTGGKFEILLLEENAANDWWVMLRPGKSARIGTQIIFQGNHVNRPDFAPRSLKRTTKAIGGCNFPARRTSAANWTGWAKSRCRLTSCAPTEQMA